MTILLIGGLLLTVLVVVWFWRRPAWMGLEGRTLWDWATLLSVPALLAAGTIGLTASQADVEQERAAEQALQQYLDRITDFALDPQIDLDAERTLTIVRAQTGAILQLTDGERAGRVILFLAELDLLQPLELSLEGHDLSGSELKELNLDGIDFENARLLGADLEGSSLRGADLEEADLTRADLKGADLRGSDLHATVLVDAALDGTDLRGVDASEAIGLEREQLAAACLDEASVVPREIGEELPRSPDCGDSVDDDDDDDEDDD